MLIPSSVFRAVAEGRAGDHRRGLLQHTQLTRARCIRDGAASCDGIAQLDGLRRHRRARHWQRSAARRGRRGVRVVIDTAATASPWRSAITSELTRRIEVLEQRPAQAKWRRRSQPRRLHSYWRFNSRHAWRRRAQTWFASRPESRVTRIMCASGQRPGNRLRFGSPTASRLGIFAFLYFDEPAIAATRVALWLR